MNRQEIRHVVYYDVNIGIGGTQKLYEYVKTHYPKENFTIEDVKDFLNKQEPNQILKQVKQTDFNYYKNYNRGYRFILIVVDTFSRRIFLRAIRDKTAANVLRGFDTIEDEYKQIGVKISNIVADEGPEFNNKDFLNHFKDIHDH